MPHRAPYRFFEKQNGTQSPRGFGRLEMEIRGRFQIWRTLKCQRSHFWGGKPQSL